MKKPKVGPYEDYCKLCWRRGELVTFPSTNALLDHLKAHFMAAAPMRILAIAK